ncbi:type II secretion system protein GspL [Salinisphaera aquimarina]|uniref:Type II secretion system protein L n=1 Tax=Salinisphaera aquimarina TaxID=2094031 RepID=A0ABV7ERJ7_9GAMM
MAERFLIHLDGEQAAWLDDGGALVRAPLAEAADAAGERESVVLIPTEHVLLTRVHLPPIRQARRRLQAASFALEDQLAARVDTLHFALAARPETSGDTAALVIDQTRMQDIIDLCRDARLDVVQIVPDALALPMPATDEWQIAVIDDRVITRTGAHRGFAAERGLWPALADGDSAPARIVAYGARAANDTVKAMLAEPAFEPEPELDVITLENDDTVLARLLAQADLSAAINMRQGLFARASAMQTWWQPFKITAGLAAAWLVLAIGARGIESWQLNQRIDALHAESVAAFRDAFPNVQTINDLRVQAEQNIRTLRGAGGSGGMFPLLQATAEVTGQAGDVTVQSMQYREGALYLSMRGDNVQSLEALRAGFARQPGASLDVQSADAAADGVQIRASVSSGAGA